MASFHSNERIAPSNHRIKQSARGDRGYDAGWFRDALQADGIQTCIPGQMYRHEPIKYDKRRYRRCSRIEIMFGQLKDWRRVATHYDRYPTVFLSAIALAATVIFQL
jgi:transposase